MKPNYPEMLPWLARRARLPAHSVEIMWLEAVRQATGDCPIIESSEFWKSAVDHLLERISVESHAHPVDPRDQHHSSLPRLQARYRVPSVSSADSAFMSGLKAQLKHHEHSCRFEGIRSDRLVEAT